MVEKYLFEMIMKRLFLCIKHGDSLHVTTQYSAPGFLSMTFKKVIFHILVFQFYFHGKKEPYKALTHDRIISKQEEFPIILKFFFNVGQSFQPTLTSCSVEKTFQTMNHDRILRAFTDFSLHQVLVSCAYFSYR